MFVTCSSIVLACHPLLTFYLDMQELKGMDGTKTLRGGCLRRRNTWKPVLMVITITCRTYLWSKGRICAYVHISWAWSYAAVKSETQLAGTWPILRCFIFTLLHWDTVTLGMVIIMKCVRQFNRQSPMGMLQPMTESWDQWAVCRSKILKIRCIICI